MDQDGHKVAQGGHIVVQGGHTTTPDPALISVPTSHMTHIT